MQQAVGVPAQVPQYVIAQIKANPVGHVNWGEDGMKFRRARGGKEIALCDGHGRVIKTFTKNGNPKGN